jgi:hypothetical protein
MQKSFIGPFGLNTEWLPGKEPDNYAIKTELCYSTNAAMTKSATDAPKVLFVQLLNSTHRNSLVECYE